MEKVTLRSHDKQAHTAAQADQPVHNSYISAVNRKTCCGPCTFCVVLSVEPACGRQVLNVECKTLQVNQHLGRAKNIQSVFVQGAILHRKLNALTYPDIIKYITEIIPYYDPKIIFCHHLEMLRILLLNKSSNIIPGKIIQLKIMLYYFYVTL